MAEKTSKKKTARKPAKESGSGSRNGGGSLLVVESPAKAKTIMKFLGRGFTVKASMGHVRDIPNRGRGKAAFGIDFEHGYRPTYAPIKGREKVLTELAAAAKKADHIYLAPDPDREGEAIAWHILEALQEKGAVDGERVSRVTFNAITKSAVKEAIDQPRQIDMNLVNAQQGRRVLDRLVGYSLSPFLWKKVTKGLSAGRVQSVAVRLVVEREREIQAFKPQEFWRITAELGAQDKAATHFMAGLVEWQGTKFELGQEIASTEGSARAIAAALEKADYRVDSIEEKESKGRVSPPFITSTLQQAASTFLRFNTDRTMRVAQQLYEGITLEGGATGLITYMRTDSTRIAPEALGDARKLIEERFGADYLPEKPQVYRSKKGAQDAHEAIRPTDVFLTPESIRPHLTEEQYKLYDLIWRRFLASQMKPAIYLMTTARIAAADGILEAKGRVVLFDGHTRLGFGQGSGKKEKKTEEKEQSDESEESGTLPDDQILPALSRGQELDLHKLDTTQHFTQPPPRYSEASLVRALEKEGIGRPSTYAPIIKTIQERGYVRQEKRRFFATELGITVTDILLKFFPKVMDIKFTAAMEEDLDRVEDGQRDWVELVDQFYKPFEERLKKASDEAEPLKGRPAPNGETCPDCGGSMVVRYSQRGAFLGCEKYPDCKGTRPMPGEESSDDGEEGEKLEVPCPACGTIMIERRSRFGPFLGCPKYPDCKYTLRIGRDGKPILPPAVEIDCDCGKRMAVRPSGRGFEVYCSACDVAKPLDKDGKTVDLPDVAGILCDKCSAQMIIRMSRRGPFLACPNYPKCRNSKSLAKIDELRSGKNAKSEGKEE